MIFDETPLFCRIEKYVKLGACVIENMNAYRQEN